VSGRTSLTSVREHLYLTEAEVILITPVISDVHVTSLVSEAIITGEQDTWILETAFESSTWFVQSFALRKKLNNKDGEFLVRI
jgi:hypothetical protein